MKCPVCGEWSWQKKYLTKERSDDTPVKIIR